MYSRQAVGLNVQDTSASNGFSGIQNLGGFHFEMSAIAAHWAGIFSRKTNSSVLLQNFWNSIGAGTWFGKPC